MGSSYHPPTALYFPVHPDAVRLRLRLFFLLFLILLHDPRADVRAAHFHSAQEVGVGGVLLEVGVGRGDDVDDEGLERGQGVGSAVGGNWVSWVGVGQGYSRGRVWAILTGSRAAEGLLADDEGLDVRVPPCGAVDVGDGDEVVVNLGFEELKEGTGAVDAGGEGLEDVFIGFVLEEGVVCGRVR